MVNMEQVERFGEVIAQVEAWFDDNKDKMDDEAKAKMEKNINALDEQYQDFYAEAE